MKPKKLGWLDPAIIPSQDRKTAKIVSSSSRRYFGDVDPVGLPTSNPYMKELLKFGAKHGLKYRPSRYYTGPCLLPIHGSVLWHDDAGIGYILNWVVEVNKISRSITENLSTPSLLSVFKREIIQIESLRPGDIFIFNGNVGHAWQSNESCLLAQVTVSVPRAMVKTSSGQ
jgi:hypothetical protein